MADMFKLVEITDPIERVARWLFLTSVASDNRYVGDDERQTWQKLTDFQREQWRGQAHQVAQLFVPVSPVRADRDAVAEAAQAVLEESIPIIGEDAAHVPNAALTALESALAALRAMPEPERAGGSS